MRGIGEGAFPQTISPQSNNNNNNNNKKEFGSEIEQIEFSFTTKSFYESFSLISLLKSSPKLSSIIAQSSFSNFSISEILQSKKALNQLKELNIKWSENVDNFYLAQLLERTNFHLKFLDLTLCTKLNSSSLNSISLYCPNLLSLSIASIPDISDLRLLFFPLIFFCLFLLIFVIYIYFLFLIFNHSCNI